MTKYLAIIAMTLTLCTTASYAAEKKVVAKKQAEKATCSPICDIADHDTGIGWQLIKQKDAKDKKLKRKSRATRKKQ